MASSISTNNGLSPPQAVNNSDQETQSDEGDDFNSTTHPSVVRLTEFDILSLPQDPGLRKRVVDYHPNDREIVQREYIRRGPCQPRNHDFPQTSARKFKAEWFKNHESWLEYSEEKDAALCFACYLFKKENAAGGDAFVNNGFKTWSRTSAFDTHEGGHMSAHNKAIRDLDNFIKQKSSIVSRFENRSAITKTAYLTRLEASIKTVRFLLLQGLSFRGHNEKESSLNRGNFIELLKLLGEHDEKIAKTTLDKAPGNCILTCSDIQKEIANACATVTTSKIIQELDGDTTSLTLKKAIAEVFKKFSLTFSRLRGQGYDGASNMQGSLNGLKTLILKESPSAYSIHCFAHQLQLIVVAVSKRSHDCSWLLETLTNLLNLVTSSPKRKEILRVKQAEQVLKELSLGEIKSGSGLNQERGLCRPGDTRWHSHFKTILSVLTLYPAILEVIDVIGESSTGADNVKAESISYALRTFDFIFIAHLMVKIFGVTNELNLSLQRKELDIVNAIKLVDVTKKSLQHMRDNGWDCHM